MHGRNIVHLDLKEPNILILHDEKNKDNPLCANLGIKIVLTDFGEARKLSLANEKIKD